MFLPYSLHWFTRRGRKPAGIRIARGWPRLSASTVTRPLIGTSVATRRVVGECSFFSPLGGVWEDGATLRMQRGVNSSGGLTSSGPGTAARGGSGAPPRSAD